MEHKGTVMHKSLEGRVEALEDSQALAIRVLWRYDYETNAQAYERAGLPPSGSGLTVIVVKLTLAGPALPASSGTMGESARIASTRRMPC